MGLKKGWDLTSEAPAREPSRRISSLTRSLRITLLQRLRKMLASTTDGVTVKPVVYAYWDTWIAPEPSGKGTSSRNIFAKVAFLFLPLNGVVPNNIS